MKESTKILSWILIVSGIFIVLRIVESVHVYSFMSGKDTSDAARNVAYSFEVYRDFVTVVTGLLTLILGTTGFFAFFSFKKLREDEKLILKRLEKEEERISKLHYDLEKKIKDDSIKVDKMYKKLEMFAKIQVARIVLDSEVDKSAAIEILKEAESLCDDSYMLFQMKGDAYYYRGERGDYNRAIDEYNKAKIKNDDSAGVWFGMSQAKYKASLNVEDDLDANSLLKLGDFLSFELVKNHYDVLNEDMVKDAILDMERADNCGLSSIQAGFELGHMYKSIGENEVALDMYKKSYDANNMHTVSGFFYCHLWMMENFAKLPHLGANHHELIEVVGILKSVGRLDLFNSKEAYALLWYLYKVVPGLGKKNEICSALLATNRFIISKLFKLKNDVASECLPSMA